METIILNIENEIKVQLRDIAIILNNNFDYLVSVNSDERMNEIVKILNNQIPNQNKLLVNNERLGKQFEMAICNRYNIPYEGKYKYDTTLSNHLNERLSKLVELFPYNLRHTASNGSRYDFTSLDDFNIKLSAKTTKKDGKICPQVIGQPTKNKFCNFFGINVNSSSEEIKRYIETNLLEMLNVYAQHTFDCPIIYYNQNLDKLSFIVLKNAINWIEQDVNFKHLVENAVWNESSIIRIKNVTIGEFQVHNHRNCIKFRWNFEKILILFANHFEIINF